MNKNLDKLKELVTIQCSGGNWNYDSYMMGFANGMILSLAIMEDKEPVYLEKPEKWLKDNRGHEETGISAVSDL